MFKRVCNVERKNLMRFTADSSTTEFTYRNRSDFVRIVEVGPRDGLQNEQRQLSTENKIEFINRLSETGLKTIEISSFVSSKWIPQFADAVDVNRAIRRLSHCSYPIFVPNLIGLEKAIRENVKEIALFTTCSNTFAMKNINRTIAENHKELRKIFELANGNRIKYRVYVSCIVGCPYDGKIEPKQVLETIEFLLEQKCPEISLGDTIGCGTVNRFRELFRTLFTISDPSDFAIHCHDTYGQALVNICTALEYGIRTVDSSVAGLGGCPYARGATGNVSSEQLVYMLHGMGIETGIDLCKLSHVSQFISELLGKPQTLPQLFFAQIK